MPGLAVRLTRQQSLCDTSCSQKVAAEWCACRPVPALQIVSVDAAAGVLVLGGVDIVDGSPVLDIKPYVPFSDALPDAVAPDWVTVRRALLLTCASPQASCLQNGAGHAGLLNATLSSAERCGHVAWLQTLTKQGADASVVSTDE